jgi:hypothetical protein
MANTFQIKRRIASASAYDPSRVNPVNYGGWGSGEYKTGDVVLYGGKYYVALHNNDALLPDVSPVYWQEVSGSSYAPAGAPTSLANGELAFNEVDMTMYYGMASGAVTPIANIGGSGNYVTRTTVQTIDGDKAFTASVVLSSASVTTAVVSASGAEVANTEFVQGVFAVLDGGYFDNNTPAPSGTGKYFYSSSNTGWTTVANWYTNANHTLPAATLPDATTDVVVIAGYVVPVVNLDAGWVQPNSIDSTATSWLNHPGIIFNSQTYGNVSCNITGDVGFNGTVTFNK